MTIHIITIIIALGTAFVSSFSTAVFFRRKNKAEAKQIEISTEGTELDNTDKAVKIWRELAEKLAADLEKYMQEVTALRNSNEELYKKLEEFKKDVAALKCENAKLKKLISELDKSINTKE